MPPAGRLITFEGGEGTGKSTQAGLLAAWLSGRGLEVVLTREPGGTDGAEAIRDLVVAGPVERWMPSTELLLMAAARDDHLRRLVLPALARGAWVVCDRYIDSTFVYQGVAGGIDVTRIAVLHDTVIEAPLPDLTVVMDLAVGEGLERRRTAGRQTRFEGKGLEFHHRVREGFLDRVRQEPDRLVLIDAAVDRAEVAAAVRALVAARLGLTP